MKLIVQIPCLNEAATLLEVLNDLPRDLPGIDCIETLVIDDGSSDGTATVAIGAGVDHIVRHKRNRGLAAAFATGLRTGLELGADIIVNTDGDHQYPGRFIHDLVAPILDGRADVVIGDRRAASDQRNSLTKRSLYRVGEWVVSRLAGSHVPDPVSGFRALSREAAARTRIVTGYSYTIESLMQSIKKGFAVQFVPIETNDVQRPSRLFRSTTQFVFRSGITLLRVFFMFHALNILLWLAAVLACVGLIPIIRFLTLYALGAGQGHLQSLVLGAALLGLAGLTFLAGMIADLIAYNRELLEECPRETASTRWIKNSKTHLHVTTLPAQDSMPYPGAARD